MAKGDIGNIAFIYYSRKDVQDAIFNFCKNRETIARHEDAFSKRPDTLEYPSDIMQQVKKGFTSFHCSQEFWEDPLKLSTELKLEELKELRTGWDLLIDIDSKYLDYSKIAASLIIQALEFHGVKNLGVKFSVSGETPILVKNREKISLLQIQEAINLIKKGEKLSVLSIDKAKKLKFSKIYDYLEHEDELYEISHENSKIPLKATAHHSVFVFENAEIKEKKVSDIKPGDFLVTFNSNSILAKSKETDIENTFEFGSNQNSKKNITNKVELTKDLMRLIGYYLSEGHITNTINQVGFTFNQNEKEYIEDCSKLLTKITNKIPSIRHPNTGSTQLLIHSKEWASFFENFCGKSKGKHLPDFVWGCSKELFLELFLGYIRGDGYKLDKYEVVIKSVCPQLIRELVWLCKLNGISCSLSTEQNKPHTLPQGTFFKGSFVYLIKIPKSEIPLEEFFKGKNKFSPYPRERTFPIGILRKIYSQIKPKKFKQQRKEESTLKKPRANLERIKKVVEWFRDYKSTEFSEEAKKIIENYESLFNSEIGVVKIKTIKKIGGAKVYDVSVEETESFFGNEYPVLLHNSGGKGMHIIVPWKAFPKEINGIQAKDMFPEWPRIITSYLQQLINSKLVEKITKLTIKEEYVKDLEEAKKVIPDLVLVSSRHLFRAPYSLHEKGLASVVIDKSQVESFQPTEANPLKAQVKNFYPEAEPEEARELLVSALDWFKQQKEKPKSNKNFQQVKLDKSSIVYPPCIAAIMLGLKDGRKRALFILINYFRSLGLEFEEIEEKIEAWNKLNKPELKQGYVSSQLAWSQRQNKRLPPNCSGDWYKGIAVCNPDNLCSKIKNPVNYSIIKSRRNSKS
ncbi:MAG: hypothetical protein NT076_04850 [Candidatus Pacearchaeota archaeon]|nr:hypothetical protein [Candidatus Pacearchaeota archaeon]